MWSDRIGKDIARILNLMADPPKLRRSDFPGEFNLVFDGGGIIAEVGITVYKFSDGTEALYGSAAEVGLTITFPTGERVRIDVTMTKCSRCGHKQPTGMKYCTNCGERCEPPL